MSDVTVSWRWRCADDESFETGEDDLKGGAEKMTDAMRLASPFSLVKQQRHRVFEREAEKSL
ncbi:amidohydrolase [Sesbania bispinosa]|nr:amidohydrolase [Sesbania bispinosa]